MGLQEKVMAELKTAMRAKDGNMLEALRAVKSELLLAQTSGNTKEGMQEEEEIKLLQKLIKQRKESAAIYKEQGREDLAEPELTQAAVIERFLPEQLSEEDVSGIIDKIIVTTGASSMKDMGKVMGLASIEIGGKADGKTISTVVKQKLTQ